MKTLISTIVWILIAFQASSADIEYGAACLHSKNDRTRYFSQFIEENSLNNATPEIMEQLFVDARWSILEDKIISIDIKPCTHNVFSRIGMGFTCELDVPIIKDRTVRRIPLDASAWIGYNHKFLHSGETETWVATYDSTEEISRPMSYGRLFGEYMYEADVWLKEKMFSDLIPLWEQQEVTPSATSLSLNFVPDITFSETVETDRTIWTLDETKIEMKGEGLDPVSESFANDIKSDPKLLEIPEMSQLFVAFQAAFLASKAIDCLGRPLNKPEWPYDSTKTPYSHQLSAGIVNLPSSSDLHWFQGGVRISPERFRSNENTPQVTDDNALLIDSIVAGIPPDKTDWTVKIGTTIYVGSTISE